MTENANASQRAFWTDEAGHKWVAQQAAMDTLLGPVLDGVLSRAALKPGEHVLDIGCGAGTSSLRAARMVEPGGSVIGLDISKTLVAYAKRRGDLSEAIEFILADAATYPFKAAQFDHLISRFGVMFFDEPVSAFSNILKALKPGAHITLATWGAIEANPYFKLAAKAARDVLGPMEKSDPDAPGPFAMRDPERVIPMLQAAGLKDVRVRRTNEKLTPSGGLNGFADIAMEIGPAEASLRHFEADKTQRAAVRQSLLQTFKNFEKQDASVEIPAEIIYYTARA